MRQSPVVLNESDRKILDDTLRKFTLDSNRKATLDNLRNRWFMFAQEVKNGYQYSLDDYINELSVRDRIEEILNKVSSEGRVQIYQTVLLSDDIYLNATQSDLDFLRSFSNNADHWWWYRIPINLGEDMKDDLSMSSTEIGKL